MKSLSCLLLSLALVAACSSPPPAPAPAGGGKKVDAASAGSLAGRVTFTGTPPKPDLLRMTADPACVQAAGATAPSDAVLVGTDGSVQNAFVYIKDGIDPAFSFDTPVTPVVLLDQKGCRYVPRVVGIRVGQPLEVFNSDDTLHNVHAMPMANQEFNRGQPAKAPKLAHTFTVPEVMVRFKCNVHGWMTAHVGVMTHPYFAVTGADGSFEIKGVPAGTYTLAVWHEEFGNGIQTVTIADREAKTVGFTLKQ